MNQLYLNWSPRFLVFLDFYGKLIGIDGAPKSEKSSENINPLSYQNKTSEKSVLAQKNSVDVNDKFFHLMIYVKDRLHDAIELLAVDSAGASMDMDQPKGIF